METKSPMTATTPTGTPEAPERARILRLLKDHGLSFDEIMETLAAASPPDTADLTRADDHKTYLGLARRFVIRHHQAIRFVHDWRAWSTWTGTHWRRDEDGEARRLLKGSTMEIYSEAFRHPEGSDKRKDLLKFAFRCESRRAQDAAMSLAQSEREVAVTSTIFDLDRWAFNTPSGTINLKTGELRGHRREDMLSQISPVAYRPNVACPRWLRFLSEIFGGDNELVGFVRRACGYSLTSDTSEQCFFVLHGGGANGKSVFMTTLRHVFGPYAFDPGFGVFEAATRFSPHPEQLAVLAGRRLITASETAENSRLNEQRLKVLAHGDDTSARHMYGTRFQFTPSGKIWLCTNHKPRVDDDSVGFWRSVRLIPFNRQFTGVDADLRLADKLKAEAEGVLAWAVRGCLEWQADGLGLPEAVQVGSDEWRYESDPIGPFLSACCILGENCHATAHDLFRAYTKWAIDEGLRERHRLTVTGLGRRLGSRFRRGTGRPVTYFGIGLLSDRCLLTEGQT